MPKKTHINYVHIKNIGLMKGLHTEYENYINNQKKLRIDEVRDS